MTRIHIYNQPVKSVRKNVGNALYEWFISFSDWFDALEQKYS